ncbi:hypothetical protein V491_02181 [Pseudogymnoascus sp. VKM F-3775]|nr:hypothetical protein V491_02181 [Pseudogymnoascus sp. VKM F-3775]
MPTPVEFISTGGFKTGTIAETVSTAVLEILNAKIADWKGKARASNHSEDSWAQPRSKKNLCVALKYTKVKTPV